MPSIQEAVSVLSILFFLSFSFFFLAALLVGP